MIYMPVLIAITLSQKSYLCELFKYSWMRYFEKKSLLIYLNHTCTRLIVYYLFGEQHGYKFCVLLMAIFTAVMIFIAAMIEFGI